MKDFYAILGISITAEKEVIDAAYKALVKKYHPDVFKGSTKIANERIREINEAYDTLSKTNKKKRYDEEFLNEKETGSFDDFTKSDFDESEDIFVNDWNILIDIFPNAEILRQNLSKLSRKLGLLFQVMLLEQKLGSKATQVEEQLRVDFLKRYFGNNEDIHKLVSRALLKGETDIAKEINKMIILLGDDAAEKIYEKINKKLNQKAKNEAQSYPKKQTNYSKLFERKFSKQNILLGIFIIITAISILFFRLEVKNKTKYYPEINNMSDTRLCFYATRIFHDNDGSRIRYWDTNWPKYVEAAKKRDLDCNILVRQSK